MNKIHEYLIEQRNGYYVHALELDSAYSYEDVIESLIGELGELFTQNDFIEFFDTIEMYYYESDDDVSDEMKAQNEDELYNFDYKQFIKDCY